MEGKILNSCLLIIRLKERLSRCRLTETDSVNNERKKRSVESIGTVKESVDANDFFVNYIGDG